MLKETGLVIKKINLKDVQFRHAPNRRIRELISASTVGAKGATLRIVDMVPASEQQPRHPHCHPTFEETMFVLKGEGRLWVEGQLSPMVEGDALLVPAGVFHQVVNVTEGPLQLACFFPIADGVGVDQQERQDILVLPEQIRNER